MGFPVINIPLNKEYYIKQGNTIDKIEFIFGADDLIDLTGATIKVQLYSKDRRVSSISTGAGITIINSKKFQIDEVSAAENKLPFGELVGDVLIQTTDGRQMTYTDLRYNVLKQYTK